MNKNLHKNCDRIVHLSFNPDFFTFIILHLNY